MVAVLLSTPVLGFVFAAGGAGLAWLWFNEFGLVAVTIAAGFLLVGFILGQWAKVALPKHPVRAVHLMQGQVLAIAAVTATVAAIAIIIGVIVVAPEPPKDAADAVKQASEELKAVITAVSAALAAFITALAVKADDIDTTIGSRVKAMFYEAYPRQGPGPEPAGTIPLPAGSAGERAVYSNYALADWSRTSRTARAKKLQDYLDTKGLR